MADRPSPKATSSAPPASKRRAPSLRSLVSGRSDALPPLPPSPLPAGQPIRPLAVPVTPSQWDRREDGTLKGEGYLGYRARPGEPWPGGSSEIGMGIEFDGREHEVPTMVPSLTPEELRYLLTTKTGGGWDQTNPLVDRIRDKAAEHAIARIRQGRSVWADPRDPADQSREMYPEFPRIPVLRRGGQ